MTAANSAISMVQPGEIDWAKVFAGSKHFHISGITPALSASASETTVEAMKAAKKAGCTVSYDLNYRKKLWTPADAKKIQEPMMANVDILITTEEDTNVVFGIKEKDYEAVAEKLAQTFNFKVVAITLREDLSVWRNNWTAIAYQDGKIFKDRKYEVEIVGPGGRGRFLHLRISLWLDQREGRPKGRPVRKCLCRPEAYRPGRF